MRPGGSETSTAALTARGGVLSHRPSGDYRASPGAAAKRKVLAGSHDSVRYCTSDQNTRRGVELPQESPENVDVGTVGGAKCGAISGRLDLPAADGIAPTDVAWNDELREVTENWETLSESIRHAILTLVRAAR